MDFVALLILVKARDRPTETPPPLPQGTPEMDPNSGRVSQTPHPRPQAPDPPCTLINSSFGTRIRDVNLGHPGEPPIRDTKTGPNSGRQSGTPIWDAYPGPQIRHICHRIATFATGLPQECHQTATKPTQLPQNRHRNHTMATILGPKGHILPSVWTWVGHNECGIYIYTYIYP